MHAHRQPGRAGLDPDTLLAAAPNAQGVLAPCPAGTQASQSAVNAQERQFGTQHCEPAGRRVADQLGGSVFGVYVCMLTGMRYSLDTSRRLVVLVLASQLLCQQACPLRRLPDHRFKFTCEDLQAFPDAGYRYHLLGPSAGPLVPASP
jgi:hypothetical protein